MSLSSSQASQILVVLSRHSSSSPSQSRPGTNNLVSIHFRCNRKEHLQKVSAETTTPTKASEANYKLRLSDDRHRSRHRVNDADTQAGRPSLQVVDLKEDWVHSISLDTKRQSKGAFYDGSPSVNYLVKLEDFADSTGPASPIHLSFILRSKRQWPPSQLPFTADLFLQSSSMGLVVRIWANGRSVPKHNTTFFGYRHTKYLSIEVGGRKRGDLVATGTQTEEIQSSAFEVGFWLIFTAFGRGSQSIAYTAADCFIIQGTLM
ncbi:uncharacterized protein BDZ83DRAFT_651712 [Colletotrichum acutatum]|uniref:Uncharacterized protein n=1 Tax=Glomerella acutata TaxID=27357 RepID=A0AAD8UPC3_GLOAC|nr:uncharacterized protein BDZ83DRAFT_651712 [Colletotrichum acutatum]KAK1724931.1 hypothetical protein BDZ83DRAFT_651712 [Colletotrichum acutatum]